MIDSHVHFWQLKRGDYTWINDTRPVLNRDYLPDEYKTLINTTDVTGCIAVQAAPCVAETNYLLKLSQTYSFITAVTGWVDLSAPTAADVLRVLRQQPKLRAIRPMGGATPGEQWFNTKSYHAGFLALQQQGLILEALAQPGHLLAIADLARIFPELKIIINHAAKPGPVDFPGWSVDIQRFSRLENVYCKISGFTQQSTDRSHQANVFDELLTAFGPHRLLWGSDFPVLFETSDYPQWLAQSNSLLRSLTAAEKAQIQTTTALGLYGVKPSCAVRSQR